VALIGWVKVFKKSAPLLHSGTAANTVKRMAVAGALVAALTALGLLCASRRRPGQAQAPHAAPLVLFAPNPKKATFFAALSAVLAGRGIRLRPLGEGEAGEAGEEPPAALLHKLSDDMACAAASPAAARRLAAVGRLAAAHPAMALLDPLPAVRRLLDRRAMAAAVRGLPPLRPPDGGAAVAVRMPPTLEVPSASARPQPPPGRGPLVVKSVAAAAVPVRPHSAPSTPCKRAARLRAAPSPAGGASHGGGGRPGAAAGPG